MKHYIINSSSIFLLNYNICVLFKSFDKFQSANGSFFVYFFVLQHNIIAQKMIMIIKIYKGVRAVHVFTEQQFSSL